MAARKSESFTGLRSWRTNVLTLPAFPMLRVNVGKSPMFEGTKRMSATMLNPSTQAKVERRFVDPTTGEVLTEGECIKGYHVDDVGYVVLEPSELDALKSDGDKDVALVALIREHEVEVEYFDKAYDLWPLTRTDADGYALIAGMLRDTGKALVGTVIEDGTTKTMVVRWSGLRGCLVSHTLNYERNLRTVQAETVREKMSAVPEPSEEMVAMAATIFGALPEAFDFGSVDDEYAERLEAAVAAKATGHAVKIEVESAPAQENVPDLMAALRASVAAVEGKKDGAQAPAKAARRTKVTA